jgi:hypothetical protein
MFQCFRGGGGGGGRRKGAKYRKGNVSSLPTHR